MDVTQKSGWSCFLQQDAELASSLNWHKSRLRKGRNKLPKSNQRGFPAFSSPFCIPQLIFLWFWTRWTVFHIWLDDRHVKWRSRCWAVNAAATGASQRNAQETVNRRLVHSHSFFDCLLLQTVSHVVNKGITVSSSRGKNPSYINRKR